MRKVDIRLQYQKETGDGLTHINRIADEPEFDNRYEKTDHQVYVEWLEELTNTLTNEIRMCTMIHKLEIEFLKFEIELRKIPFKIKTK